MQATAPPSALAADPPASLGAQAFRFGQVLGKVELADLVLQRASSFAAEHYLAEEAKEFSGEDVETFSIPSWAPSREAWVPAQQLADLGYRLAGDGAGEEMVATLGVDQHVDAVYGRVLCLVLHNDGLVFRQGRVSHKPVAGDWFVFNDRAKHGVKEAKGKSVFVALTLPLMAYKENK